MGWLEKMTGFGHWIFPVPLSNDKVLRLRDGLSSVLIERKC